MADFWGIEDRIPEFYDKRGVSLVLVNTIKGAAMFSKLADSCEYVEATKADAVFRQKHLNTPVKPSIYRDSFWKLYREKGYLSAAKKYANCSMKQHLKHSIKRASKVLGVYTILSNARSHTYRS